MRKGILLIRIAFLSLRVARERRKNAMLREMYRTLTGKEWPEGSKDA
jgi:hypothetical protein